MWGDCAGGEKIGSKKRRFRIYIDESGDHTYQTFYDDGNRYLCLLGLIIEDSVCETNFNPSFEELKQKHFPHPPEAPVIFHRNEMVRRIGPFKILKDPQKDGLFVADILHFLKSHSYQLIAVTIDKERHINKYGCYAHDPYDFCLAMLLERYCGFLQFLNSIGDVLSESRGGREDLQLKKAYRHIYQKGTRHRKDNFFQNVLTSGEIKIKPKTANIVGLQVTDLLVYHAKQDMLVERCIIPETRSPFAKSICEIINDKYNRQKYNGRVDGYGKKFI
jgi:hypothetical protein